MWSPRYRSSGVVVELLRRGNLLSADMLLD
jgi:hypothetical protein